MIVIDTKKEINDISSVDGLNLFEVIELNSFITMIEKEIQKTEYKYWDYFQNSLLIKNIKKKGIFSSKSSVNMIYDSKLYKSSKNIYFGYGHKSMLMVITDKGLVFSKCRIPSNNSEFTEELYWDGVFLKIKENSKIEINITNPLEGDIYSGINNFYTQIYNIVSNLIWNSKTFKTLISKTKSDEKQFLKIKKTTLVSKFDKDNNGTLDIIEEKNEFNLILKKHQNVVLEKGKEFNQNFTHQFIKVSNYIKQKGSNLQSVFKLINKVQNQQELNEYSEILEQEIYSYNLLLINSLNLIVSLIEDDQITFYDIYEKFDKLNIYNSNWENEISQKLTTLNKSVLELNLNIRGLMYEIRDMGDRIVNSIEDLSYITEKSTNLLNYRLEEINSSIDTTNLLSMIQTYQTYKINKNTKSLRD